MSTNESAALSAAAVTQAHITAIDVVAHLARAADRSYGGVFCFDLEDDTARALAGYVPRSGWLCHAKTQDQPATVFALSREDAIRMLRAAEHGSPQAFNALADELAAMPEHEHLLLTVAGSCFHVGRITSKSGSVAA